MTNLRRSVVAAAIAIAFGAALVWVLVLVGLWLSWWLQ